jgi:hypothetical protein
MPVKQDISKMSVEELAAYVEAARAKHRERSKRYYDNQIKGEPDKCKKFLEKWKNKIKLIIILQIRIILYKLISTINICRF